MYKKYYDDPGLLFLETEVEQVKESPQGLLYSFKETIIYPGGGGQLPDKALVNDQEVSAIVQDENFIGYRIAADNKLKTGDAVTLKIDSNFRLYNMQQHSGQHLLSAVMDDLGFKTVSVHLGEEYTLIEVEGGIPDAKQIMQIEERSNALIRKALPVKTQWLDKNSAQKLNLRKPPGDFEKLRIVSIEGVDHSACGGTHVTNSADIGLIKCTGLEKIRGNARLQFKIGTRAYSYLDQLHKLQLDLVAVLKTAPEKLKDKVEDIVQEKEVLFRKTQDLQKILIPLQAAQIINTRKNPHVHIYWQEDEHEKGADLAKEIFRQAGQPVFVLAADRFYYVCPEQQSAAFQKWLRENGHRYEMRGGGAPGFMQGVFNTEKRSDLLSDLEDLFKGDY